MDAFFAWMDYGLKIESELYTIYIYISLVCCLFVLISYVCVCLMCYWCRCCYYQNNTQCTAGVLQIIGLHYPFGLYFNNMGYITKCTIQFSSNHTNLILCR